MKRFDGLTKAQDEAVQLIAFGGDGRTVHPKTLDVLLRRGLIVQTGEEVICRDRFGVVTAPVYQMPLGEHMRYCQWCADNFPDSDASSPQSAVSGSRGPARGEP